MSLPSAFNSSNAIIILLPVAMWQIEVKTNDLEPMSGCLGEEFANCVNLEMMSFKAS